MPREYDINDAARSLDQQQVLDWLLGWQVINPGGGSNEVTAGTGDFVFDAAAGDINAGGSIVTCSQESVDLATDANVPDADEASIVVIYRDNTGTLQFEVGPLGTRDPAADDVQSTHTPAAPSMNDISGVVLAEVLVPAGASSVGDSEKRDRRDPGKFLFDALDIESTVTLGDEGSDPSANGEIQRNSGDVKVFSGGAVRDLSDVAPDDLPTFSISSSQNTSGPGIYLVDTSSAAVTLTLDTDDVSGDGPIGVVNVTGSNDVTVDTEGGETIDPNGDSSKTLGVAGWLYWFSPDGTNWDSSLAGDFESIAFKEALDTQVTASEGTSYNIDLEAGNYHKVTMTGDVDFDFTNVDSTDVNSVILHLVQDGTGARTPSFTTPTVVAAGGSAPSWSTGANEEDVVTLVHDQDGSQWILFEGALTLGAI